MSAITPATAMTLMIWLIVCARYVYGSDSDTISWRFGAVASS
jgi:hypothetical protein